MLSYKVDHYTRTHNLRIGDFGSIRLLKFHYTDAQWAAFVAENGDKLDYTK